MRGLKAQEFESPPLKGRCVEQLVLSRALQTVARLGSGFGWSRACADFSRTPRSLPGGRGRVAARVRGACGPGSRPARGDRRPPRLAGRGTAGASSVARNSPCLRGLLRELQLHYLRVLFPPLKTAGQKVPNGPRARIRRSRPGSDAPLGLARDPRALRQFVRVRPPSRPRRGAFCPLAAAVRTLVTECRGPERVFRGRRWRCRYHGVAL